MNVPNLLVTDVRDQIFADWAVPVTFRHVVSTYDPATGVLSETYQDISLSAIAGPAVNETTTNTAAHHRTCERAFLVRTTDLPENTSLMTSRILYEGIEHVITAADHAATSDIVALTTRTMA